MAHHRILSVVALAAAALLLAPPGAAAWYPPLLTCNATDNFSGTSRYLANIKRLGTTLPTNASTSPSLFATATAGAAPDQVAALALCRGDTNATSCLACLDQAFRDLPNACVYNKDATIYYDRCTLHYSGVLAVGGDDDAELTVNITVGDSITSYSDSDPARFNLAVAKLVNATADYAAYNSTRRYAAGEVDFDGQEFPRVYSMAQCTPDLRPARCRRCLAGIILSLPELFPNYTDGTVLGVRCSFRYDTSSFLDGPVMFRQEVAPSPGAPPELAPSPAPAALPLSPAPAAVPTATGVIPAAAVGAGGRKYSVPGMVLIVLLPTLAAINIIIVLCFWRRKKQPTKAKQSHLDYTTEAEDMESVDSMMIDISTLRSATGDFAESNKLGAGGFGAVYKGTLPDGTEIAVKRLSKSSTQGVEELKNELALVAKLKHRNLVSLVGVCLEQQERLLVYEFVPNRSLDQILFDPEKREQLDWEKRFNIINGIARGLQYLHEDSQLKVVHRDLKASNILLDMNMNPKISDFGLARLFGRDQTQAVTSRVIGTYGYMAPEYVMRGNYSVKSDAYSFGVMVLEIVTGRRNNDCYNSQQSEDLLTMVWEHWTAGRVSEIVDAGLNGRFMEGDVRRCIHIGLMCVQGNPVDRPMMSAVVMMLGSDTVSLRAPSKPAFLTRSSDGGDKSGVVYSLSTA